MRGEKVEEFHVYIRKTIEDMIKGTTQLNSVDDIVIKSNHCACREEKLQKMYHELPLYFRDERREAYQYRDVDLIIRSGSYISGIIEIEESRIGPVGLFGKFSATCATKYWIPHKDEIQARPSVPVCFGESVIFVQVIKHNRDEDDKLDNIRKYIQDIMVPALDTRMEQYELLYGREIEFEKWHPKWKELAKLIRAMLLKANQSPGIL